MKIEFKVKFLNELAKIPEKPRKEIEYFLFEEFPADPSFKRWSNIIPLKGEPQFQKMLFGDYRIGIRIRNDVVIFERIRHRNDIYRIRV